MKKIISSVMAAAMVASMSTVAFAAEPTTLMVNDESRLYKEVNGVLYETNNDQQVKPGDKIYVEILSEGYDKITSYDIKNHKVATEWLTGGEVFQKTEIENKKVAEKTGKLKLAKGKTAPYGLKDSYDSLEELTVALNEATKHDENCKLKDCDDATHILPLTEADKANAVKLYTEVYTNDYRYFVAVYTKSSFNVKSTDFVGSVKLIKRTHSNATQVESKVINTVVGYDKTEVTGSYHTFDNANPVLDFSQVDGEIELIIGDMAIFSVNVANQNDIYMGYNTKPDTDILDQNPNANIDFLNFEAKPEFSRIGTMMILSDKEVFVYEKTNTGLKLIKTSYDEDYEAHTFKTRTLSSYVISDSELKFTGETENPSETPAEKPTEKPTEKPNDDKGNPPTGTDNGMMAATLMLILSTVGAATLLKKVK